MSFYSDGHFTFWTPRRGCGRFILRSRMSGYEHEFDWSGEAGDDVVSVATLRHLGPANSFTHAVNLAKAWMLDERTMAVHNLY